MNARLGTARIWAPPTAFGIMTAGGLLSALVADGVWDVLSWAALAAPAGGITGCCSLGAARG